MKQKRFEILLIILALLVISIPSRATTILQFPITITNNQGAATANGFQQSVVFNALSYHTFEANDLGNIRFTYGALTYNSWCEIGCNSLSTNTLIWVLLPNSIAAHSSNTINMTFLTTNTEYDGKIAGECPECSITGFHNVITNNVISYTSASATTGLTSGTVTTPVLGGGNLWICASAQGLSNGGTITGTSYSQDVNDGQYNSTIGQQATNACATTTTDGGLAMSAIELNTNGIGVMVNTASATFGGSAPVGITLSSNSFVVWAFACGGDACDGGKGSISVPAGCNQQTIADFDNFETTAIYTCNSLAAGSYSGQQTVNSGFGNMSTAAYVFSNYSSVLTPFNAIKYDNGGYIFNYYNNGNTIAGLTSNQVGCLQSNYNSTGVFGYAYNIISVCGQGAGPQNNQEAVVNTPLLGDGIIEGRIDIDGNNNGFFSARAPNLAGNNCLSYLFGNGWNGFGTSVQLQNLAHCSGTLGLFFTGNIKYGWYWNYGALSGNYLNSTLYTAAEGSIVYSVNGHDSTLPSNNPYMGLAAYDGLSAPAYFADVRVRQFPPNNIMPSITFTNPFNAIYICNTVFSALTANVGWIYTNNDPANTLSISYVNSSSATVNSIAFTEINGLGNLYVGQQWNYSFSQTPNAVVRCIKVNPSLIFPEELPNLTMNQYAPMALVSFILGMILSSLALSNFFGIWKINRIRGFVRGLVLFGIGMGAIILLIVGGIYQTTITVPAYSITTPTSTFPVTTTQLVSSQLASIRPIESMIILIGILDGVVGVMGFYVAFIDGLGERKKKRQRRSDA